MYVECDRCHEKIRFHVDMRNDLSIQYGESEKEDVYFTRKRIIGSQGCFQAIDVELTFDKNRRLMDQQITGGRFISQEEYAMQDSPSIDLWTTTSNPFSSIFLNKWTGYVRLIAQNSVNFSSQNNLSWSFLSRFKENQTKIGILTAHNIAF